MKKRTIRNLEIFLHFLTAFILLIKGYDEIKKGLYYPALIIIGLAMTVLIIMIFWRKLRIRPKEARTACYYIESPAMFITAYVLYLEQKESLPPIFIMAGIIYPAVGFISSKKFKRFSRQVK